MSGAAGVEAYGVSKSFGETVVLDGIDLTVAAGTIFALLGPNGAGKTTMVRMLSTLLPADSGQMRVAVHDVVSDPDGVRAAIGVTGQFSALDELFTGEENLRLMADLHHLGRTAGRRRVAELLDRFDLVDAARKPVSTYSGGMKRRLDLAMTLVGSPRVIFLDEPTTGLDPRSRRTVWQSIRDLVAGGTTVLLTTQPLDEADQLADRIAVLDHGRIMAEGTPGELTRRIPGGHIQLNLATPDSLVAAASLLEVASQDEEKLELQVPSDGSAASLRELLNQLHNARLDVGRVSFTPPTWTTCSSRSPASPAQRKSPVMTTLAYGRQAVASPLRTTTQSDRKGQLMSYSHADANLHAVLALQQETAQLLDVLAATDAELASRLCEEADETTRDTH